MLKVGFIGRENDFTHLICDWLTENSDLALILWTNRMAWNRGRGWDRARRIALRFLRRGRKRGWLRAADEFLYFVLYRNFIHRRDARQLAQMVAAAPRHPRRSLHEIKQIRPASIRSPDVLELVRAMQLDALFVTCMEVYLPEELIDAPRYGSFLWHEGITPEYRGVHASFWALLREDYDNVGYTLLHMNSKLDAGEIYVQGQVRGVDLMRDWHSYIAHKAVLDSLPDVKRFLHDLECNQAFPVCRNGAHDGYYSYPTGPARTLRSFGKLG